MISMRLFNKLSIPGKYFFTLSVSKISDGIMFPSGYLDLASVLLNKTHKQNRAVLT